MVFSRTIRRLTTEYYLRYCVSNVSRQSRKFHQGLSK